MAEEVKKGWSCQGHCSWMALLSFHKLRQEGGRLLNFQHQPIDGYGPPLKSRHNFAWDSILQLIAVLGEEISSELWEANAPDSLNWEPGLQHPPHWMSDDCINLLLLPSTLKSPSKKALPFCGPFRPNSGGCPWFHYIFGTLLLERTIGNVLIIKLTYFPGEKTKV